MPQTDLTLAAITGSRICHDLASPLGAIANGLELLELAGAAESPELALMRESVAGARAALDLLRLAFGRAPDGETLSAEKMLAVLGAHLRNRPRLALEWQVTGTVPRSEAQLVLLCLLGAEDALPRGGTLCVTRAGTGWRITAQGPGLAPAMPLWHGAANHAPLPSPDPRHAHFFFLYKCLALHGSCLSATLADDRLCVTF